MIPRRLAGFVVLALTALMHASARASESWMVLKFNGAESGYMHSSTRSLDGASAGGFETTTEMQLTLRRLGTEIALATREVVVEDARGQVVTKHAVQTMSGTPTTYAGRVVGDELVATITGAGKTRELRVPWDDDVPGPAETKRRLLALQWKEGATFSAQTHDFLASADLTEATWIIGPVEPVVIDGATMRLHRVVLRSPPQPDSTLWFDDQGDPQKSSQSMAGIDSTTEATTREHVARFIDGSASGAELMTPMMIASNVRLPDPHTLTSITYAISPKQPGARLPDLASEAQHVTPDGSGGLVLTVVARTPPQPRRQALPIAAAAADLGEFLAPSSMVESDAPEIVALAKQGVGDATDPWVAAQRLEALAHRTITTKSMDIAFASALEVCRSKSGDCTEHATLLVALCRAAGIPARVAMGLGYIPGQFGGHAWTEVSIDGSWYGLDGTHGIGVADPTHIRMGATSLQGGALGDAMFGIANGLGTLDLKIVEYARGDVVTKVP